jgi:aminoglycoside phosphotransferase family enzyme
VLPDCLEFDDQLRYVDRIHDAAFLAMELEFRGREDPADHFLDTYSNFADDHALPRSSISTSLTRALVRAKVDCVRFAQGTSMRPLRRHVISRSHSNTFQRARYRDQRGEKAVQRQGHYDHAVEDQCLTPGISTTF